MARLSSFSFKSLSLIKFVIYLVNSAVLICRVPLSEKNESLMRYMCSFCKVFTVRRKRKEGQNNDEEVSQQRENRPLRTLLIDFVEVALDLLLNIHINGRQVPRTHLNASGGLDTALAAVLFFARCLC